MDMQYIPTDLFCQYHQVEASFVNNLSEYGLIQIRILENKPNLLLEEIPKIERMIRMYYDLNINIEGIETINHLLEQMELMQTKINQLHNRLAISGLSFDSNG